MSSDPQDTATHVIEWNHPDVLPGRPAGAWSLQPVEDFRNLDLTVRDDNEIEAGIDADPGSLAAWAEEKLGYPVRLTREDDVIAVMRLPAGAETFLNASKLMIRAAAKIVPRRSLPRRLYWVAPATPAA